MASTVGRLKLYLVPVQLTDSVTPETITPRCLYLMAEMPFQNFKGRVGMAGKGRRPDRTHLKLLIALDWLGYASPLLDMTRNISPAFGHDGQIREFLHGDPLMLVAKCLGPFPHESTALLIFSFHDLCEI